MILHNNQTNLYLVRHGETEFNIKGLSQGWCDSPLTQKGIAAAENLGQGLRGIDFKSIYASDAGRAVATAEIIAKQAGLTLAIQKEMGLREWNMGGLEGKETYGKYMKIAAEKAAEEGHPEGLELAYLAQLYQQADPDKTAESYEQASKRILDCIQTISHYHSNRGGGNILIISHGMAILTILAEIRDNKYFSKGVDNASVTKIAFENGSYRILAVSDTSYAEKGKNLE